MPYYKGEEFILESVLSVKDQTFRDFELIVVDDCSPGQPASEALKSLCDEPWLRIVRHEVNRGLADSRNTAAELALSDYLLPLDCDDLLRPEFLETCYNELLSRSEYSAVFTQIEVFGVHEEIWSPSCEMTDIMAGNPVTSTILFDRAIYKSVNGFRSGMRRSVDSDFWIRALNKGWKVLRIDKPLFLYRKHPDSISVDDRLTEVTDLYQANPELYKENIGIVLEIFEKRYNKLRNEYIILDEGFRLMESGYNDLLARYDDAVERLQQRSARYQLNRVLGRNRENV